MRAIKVQSVVEEDGTLSVSGLPFHRGDRIEAMLTLVEKADDQQRETARSRFLESAARSTFRSTSPYPTRDQLHERD